MDYPIGIWLSSGSSVFKIVETDGYHTDKERRGQRMTTNEFYMRVQPGHDVKTEADAERLASLISMVLNREEKLQDLIEKQIPGRKFIILDKTQTKFWESLTGNWYENPAFATLYNNPYEAYHALDGLHFRAGCQHLLGDDRLSVCIFDLPFPTGRFINPINEDGKPFVVLRGLRDGNVFWSASTKGVNASTLVDGTVAYEVVGFCDTEDEATTLYRKSF